MLQACLNGPRTAADSGAVPMSPAALAEAARQAVAAALLGRGIGVEAGLWSGTDGPERFARSPLAPRVLRVPAEVTATDPDTATATARELLAAVAGSGHGRPVLLHGSDGGAWPVLRLARERGLDTRIGIEDTLLLPDGRPAADNAQLIRAATAGREWYGA
ncbi:3-keto-5-aminohexanoate cleavage protein [Streptomyces lydicus]|uniref:3-keto-5-aminohexanoate cleavage protein n=1 Tax=Streptomyces lydicus TaxID=47763 RepID=UPI0036FD0E9D